MLYLLFIERGKKREKQPRAFFPVQTCLIGCAAPGFFQLLGTIKVCF
jgi:hypothetical protein